MDRISIIMKIQLEIFCSRVNIVGVIASKEDLTLALANPKVADVFEWRVDCYQHEGIESEITKMNSRIILTVRDPGEGGKQLSWGIDKRSKLYRRYMSTASFIDIEASTAQNLKDIIMMAKDTGVTVMISLHRFTGTLDDYEIRSALDVCVDVGGDLFKVVARPNNLVELCEFLSIAYRLEKIYAIRIIPMALETFGKISRIMAALNGSPLVYTSLAGPVVSGQWKASEFMEMLERVRWVHDST